MRLGELGRKWKKPGFRVFLSEFSGIFRRVDVITQAALGAAMGELMMGQRLGNRALAWGALFGCLPELIECLPSPFLDTAREIACGRGLGHSVILIPLASWGIARGLAKLWTRENIQQLEAWRFVLVVWLAHVFVDCFTVEGAALCWPFSIKHVAFNMLPDFDLLFSAPLIVMVIWLAFLRETKGKKTRNKKPTPLSKRKKICYWCFGLSFGYALLGVGLKFIASAGFEADLARRKTVFVRRMESPTPFNLLLWRCVVDRESELWVGYRTIFEWHETPVRWTVYLKGEDALAKVADLRETKTLTNATNGWWISRPNMKGAWLGDMRFCETRTWGSKKGAVDSRLAISWLIDSTADRNRLREILPENAAPGHLSRMGKRIFGDRENWEANPRLAGTKGSLPEFLPVEE